MNQPSPSDDEPIIQTVAEPLQQVLQQAAAAATPNSPVAPRQDQAAAPPAAGPARSLAFRPTNRQPMAMLTILDDGSREEGETIRIRDSRLSIGREKGDVTIPFDSDISAQHCELRCQKQKGKFRWYLIDPGSTNGTFLRAYRASLSRETELLFGSRRYLFQLPSGYDDGTEETQALQTQTYQAPSRTMHEHFLPRLTETGVSKGNPAPFTIGSGEVYIGRDAACGISVPDDPFLSPKHARFSQDERGRWMIEDRKSLNGVWIRIHRMALDQPAEFQLGQQRFRFQPKVNM